MSRVTTDSDNSQAEDLYTGELQDFTDRDYQEIVNTFFER